MGIVHFENKFKHVEEGRQVVLCRSRDEKQYFLSEVLFGCLEV